MIGAVFLDVAKAFDTLLVDGLPYKLTILSFPFLACLNYIVLPKGRTLEASFQSATSTRRRKRARVAQRGII
jgi:hypothetical protein